MLLAGRRWTELSAEEFYAVVYTLMLEEAGSREHLEEVLTGWAAERHMPSATGDTEVTWDQADRIALSLLGQTE